MPLIGRGKPAEQIWKSVIIVLIKMNAISRMKYLLMLHYDIRWKSVLTVINF